MVVVQVAKEQRGVQGLASLPGAFCQVAPQRDEACPGVEDDGVTAGVDFDAGCVAAIADGISARRGVTAAHSPEFDGQVFVHFGLLAGFGLKSLPTFAYCFLRLLSDREADVERKRAAGNVGTFSQSCWEVCLKDKKT